MQAYVFTEYGSADTQELQDVPTPAPGPSEVRIAVRAAGVNPVDWKIREGWMREFSPVDFPAVLGGEAAGVVEEVGQDVDGFSIGDEVFGKVAPGSGGYGEQALLTASLTARKPTGVPFASVAVLPVAGATAFDALTQLKPVAGETLLINGIGGGVGVVAAQLARDREVTVVGVGGEDKRALAESFGAIFVASGADVADRVRQILPDGVDAVLDLAGGDALRAVAGLSKDAARVVSAGDPGVTELGGAMVERDATAAPLVELAGLISDGKLDPHVIETFPLTEAGAALQSVENGHARGKIVIEIG